MLRGTPTHSSKVEARALTEIRASTFYKEALKEADATASRAKKQRSLTHKTEQFRDPKTHQSFLRVEVRMSVMVVPEAKDDERNPVNFQARMFAWWRVDKDQKEITLIIEATHASKTEDYESAFLFGPKDRFCFVQTDTPELGLPRAALICQIDEGSTTTVAVSNIAEDFCDCPL